MVRRIRGSHQCAQLIMRMSAEERAVIHDLAESAGLSAVQYLLELAAADAAGRGQPDLSARLV